MERKTGMDVIMDEHILLGGEVKTRREFMNQLRAEGEPEMLIDWAVFRPRALTDEDLKALHIMYLALIISIHADLQRNKSE